MINLIKRYLWVIIMLIVLLPIVLNFILQIPRFTPIVGNNETWLNFWVTYISAVASFAMVFITYYALKESKKQNDAILKQNKAQLEELKRQWAAEHRPYIILYIKYKGYGLYSLVLKNTGKIVAEDITFRIDSDFLESIKFILLPKIRTAC